MELNTKKKYKKNLKIKNVLIYLVMIIRATHCLLYDVLQCNIISYKM